MKHFCLPARGRFRPVLAQASTCQAGYTLIEILVTLGISLVLTGMAYGSFAIIRHDAMVADINDLLTDLYYSRTEAIKRHTTITLCRSNDGLTCSREPDWENGWMIFSDRNRNRQVDGNDAVLRVSSGLDLAGSLSLGSGYYHYIMFNSAGEAYPRNTFKLCRPGSQPRAIILFATGRARISRLDSSGNPLKCG